MRQHIGSRRARLLIAASATGGLALGLLAATPTTAATLPEGIPDLAFSGDGRTTVPIGTTGGDGANGVVLRGDGSVLLVGAQDDGTEDAVVTKLKADGSIDTAYGSQGSTILSSPSYRYVWRDAAPGPNGTLVVGGERYDVGSGAVDILIGRLTSGGALDASFSGDGIQVLDPVSGSDRLGELLVHPDGRVVYASRASLGGGVRAGVIGRLLANGTVDTAFNGGHLVLPSRDASPSLWVTSVVRKPDDTYVVAGWVTGSNGYPKGQLVGVLSNGKLDGAFGSGEQGGIAITPWPQTTADAFLDVAIDPSGRLMVLGTGRDYGADSPVERPLVARFALDGTRDSSFAAGAGVLFVGGLDDMGLYAGALDGKGRYVVAGYKSSTTWVVARIGLAGALDAAFGSAGRVSLAFTNGEPGDVSISSTGRIAVAGTAVVSGVQRMAVARYLGDRTTPSRAVMAYEIQPVARSGSSSVGWTATDDNTGVASYDVRYRSASATTGVFGSYTMWKSRTSATSSTITGSSGRTYCLSSRARDRAGNVGAYGNEWCVSFPVDDRGLTRSTGWSALSGSTYYRGTALRSTTAGATLRLVGADYRRLTLMATTCKGCGTVKVLHGSTVLATISLASETTVHRVLFPIRLPQPLMSGTVTVRQASAGKPVIVDGLAVALK